MDKNTNDKLEKLITKVEVINQQLDAQNDKIQLLITNIKVETSAKITEQVKKSEENLDAKLNAEINKLNAKFDNEVKQLEVDSKVMQKNLTKISTAILTVFGLLQIIINYLIKLGVI